MVAPVHLMPGMPGTSNDSKVRPAPLTDGEMPDADFAHALAQLLVQNAELDATGEEASTGQALHAVLAALSGIGEQAASGDDSAPLAHDRAEDLHAAELGAQLEQTLVEAPVSDEVANAASAPAAADETGNALPPGVAAATMAAASAQPAGSAQPAASAPSAASAQPAANTPPGAASAPAAPVIHTAAEPTGMTERGAAVPAATPLPVADAQARTVDRLAAELRQSRAMSEALAAANMPEARGKERAEQALAQLALNAMQNAAARGAAPTPETLTPSTLVSPLVSPAATTAAPTTAPAAPATFAIPTPVQQAAWGEAMAERVVWMAKNNIQQAGVRLNPAELGPVEIRIVMKDDQASVVFNAQHAVTREALEAALPRLREMFAQSGINLADANVSQQPPGQGRHGSQTAAREDGHGAAGNGTAGGDSADEGSLAAAPEKVGLVDYYA